VSSQIGFERAEEAALALTEPGLPRPTETVGVGQWRQVIRRYRKNVPAMIAIGFVILLFLIAIFGSFLEPQNPAAIPHHAKINTGPSAAHWLGTDDVGRDLFSRLIEGTRASIEVGSLVVLIATAVALPLGLIAGYAGRWADAAIMRVMDALFTFPPLTLALAVAALLGPNITNASIAIGIVFIPGFVRLIRSQVLAVREETFIEASRSVGVGPARMVRKHVLPNVVSPLIVQVALAFGYALLSEAGLSFLGLGVQDPPHASWGTMLQHAYNYIIDKPWGMIPPGIAIALAVLAFNLVGDGLRDSLGREVFKVKGDR
jgi:ABC-type dipeptide/oligopeptide/nickel transport system permease subunit